MRSLLHAELDHYGSITEIVITMSSLPFQVDNKLPAYPSLLSQDRTSTLRALSRPPYCFTGHDSGNSGQLPTSRFPRVRIKGVVKIDNHPMEVVVNR